jgi:hypothetical protein
VLFLLAQVLREVDDNDAWPEEQGGLQLQGGLVV